MEYQQIPPQGNGKKAIIVASVAAVAVAGAVLAVLLIRNARLQTEIPADGTTEVSPTDGDGSWVPLGAGMPSAGGETQATVIKDPTGPLPPDGPSGTDLSSPPPRGIRRPLTTAEKTQYGFDTTADIWMVTSNPTDGSRPVASFENRSLGAATFPSDADNDGLSDADEGRLGTDPKKVDTDDDGMTDGDEVYTYKTDPLKADTDGDGVSDHDETEGGSDPLKP